MRALIFSTLCACAAASAPALGQDVDPFAAREAQQAQRAASDAAPDPSATAAQADPFEAPPSAPPASADAATQPPPAAEAQDPFATGETTETTPAPADAPSSPPPAATPDPFASLDASDDGDGARVSASLDVIYQATYIPDLIRSASADQFENQAFLDTVFTWDVSDTAKFRARGLLSHVDRKVGSTSTHRGDAVGLEYFYEQQFAERTQAVSIGRRNIGWSAGFQWRPADLIENGFTTKNVDTLDPNRYRGVDQVRYEAVHPAFDVVAVVSNHEKRFYKGEQFAARLGFKSIADVSLMYAKSGSYSRKYGLTVDSNLPWATTLVLEAVHVRIDEDKLTDPFYFGERLESLTGIGSYEDIYLGLTKFIDDKRRVSFEYFHNGRGVKGALQSPAPSASSFAFAQAKTVNQSIFTEEYLGRNYIYATYTGYSNRLKLQIKPSVLMNTDDKSYIGSISLNRELGGNSELTLNINTFNGDGGSEFGAISRGVGVGASYILHVF